MDRKFHFKPYGAFFVAGLPEVQFAARTAGHIEAAGARLADHAAGLTRRNVEYDGGPSARGVE
jgi:hypothetical protein